MTDHETHPAGTADLVSRLRNAAGIDQMEYPYPMCDEAADRIEQLEAALTRANAATAAAYEVAARALDTVADQWSCGHPAMHCDCARDIEQWGFAAEEVRALAARDQTAALDKLIAKAVAPYKSVLKDLIYHADEISSPLVEAQLLLAASKKGGQ